MRHTMAFTKAIYLCCLLLHNVFALQLPPSPCPNVFAYEGDAESDRWHGVITFSSNIELVGMNYKVQLDRPSQLLVSWDGEVRSDDNTNYNVFDPFHTQRGGEVVKARIMVKFNPSNGIPGILRIVINGNTMCARDGNWGSSGFGVGLSADSTTARPDPSFNEGDDTASEFSNNRGQSSHNYNENSPNYNSENNQNFERPNSNRPSYGNNEGSYSGSNSQNYNSNRPPATNSPVYVVNPSNTGANSNSYVPSNSNSYGGNGGSFSGQNTYTNSEYPNSNRPQWSDTSSSNNYNNRTNNWQSNGFSNSPSTVSGESNANGGPIVTTLTLPNANPNKTNVDQIVQIIKNQLEQQQISVGSNKTVIVAVVNSMPNGGSPINSSNNSATTTDSPVVYRTTTIPTSTVSSKAKIVVSTAKSSSSNGHTSRP